MQPRIMTLLFFTLIFLVIDYYVFQAILTISKNWSTYPKNIIRYAFWIPTVLSIGALFWWAFGDLYKYSPNVRNWVLTALFAAYFSKIFAVAFLLVEDITRGIRWLANLFVKDT